MPNQFDEHLQCRSQANATEDGRPTQHGDSRRRTMSIEEAARILGISRGSAYARARDGAIPTIRLGKRLLVPQAALDRLLTRA
jgi:excisionase family DNA binding protein